MKPFVKSILEGWKNVDETSISIKENSGGGGSTIYLMTCENAAPPAIGFHWRTNSATHGISDERHFAAYKVFQSHGAAP